LIASLDGIVSAVFADSLILEVGGGSTEIMLLRRGRMAGAHSLRIGTVRIDEQVRGAGVSAAYLRQYLEDNVRTACDHLDAELPLESVKTFIVIGSDARLAATRISPQGAAADGGEDYAVIERADFIAFADDAAGLSPEDCVAKLRVPWADAEGIGYSLTIERLFLERTGAEEVVVPARNVAAGSCGKTVVFYESPHRVVKTLAICAEVFGPETRAAIGRELTKKFEEIIRGTLAELQQQLSARKEILGEFVVSLNPRSNVGDEEMSEEREYNEQN